MKCFGVDRQSRLVYIGDFADLADAEQNGKEASLKLVWHIDEDTAKVWYAFLGFMLYASVADTLPTPQRSGPPS